MPRNKDLKRLTRARMRKTGESYTTARAHLLKKGERPSAAVKGKTDGEAKPDLAALAGMSDEAVRKATGCDWEKWVWALDNQGAQSMPHREIAQLVHEKWKIPGWWAQTVTVGYERIHGLRAIGQRRGGSWEANKSKTLPVSVARLYRAFSVANTRKRWLTGAKLEVRKATPGKSMRITWEDATPVDVYFYAKGEAKSQVAIQHRKLASQTEADRLKKFWGERLAALAELMAT